MADDYNDLDINNEEGGETPPPPSGGTNRTFIIAVAILGGLFLLALAAILAYVFLLRPGLNRASQIAAINAQNTATVQALTQAAAAAAQQRTLIPKAFTNTPIPSATLRPTNTSTPVLAVATTGVPGLSQDQARTATVAALLTQAAEAQLTGTVRGPTSTALPTTGFADEVGLPGLFGLGLVLLAVIFVVRRLRSS